MEYLLLAGMLNWANFEEELGLKALMCLLGVVGCGCVLLAGCATVKEAYYPRQLGAVSPPGVAGGIQISIAPESTFAIRGEPIRFQVEFENMSDGEVRVPRQPHILLVWTYSNGQRDNFLAEAPEERFYRPQDVVSLGPGGKLQVQVPVKTHYFPRLGITEFRAIVKSPRNTNPAVGEVWQGQALSNRYGILVTESRERTRRGGTEQVAWLR